MLPNDANLLFIVYCSFEEEFTSSCFLCIKSYNLSMLRRSLILGKVAKKERTKRIIQNSNRLRDIENKLEYE